MKLKMLSLKSVYTAIFCIIALSGCIPPQVDNRGHVDAFNRTDQVKIGASTREEVMELLGSPSVTNNFGEEIWYYVSKRKESVAFLKPEITQQKVTGIVFDSSGVVTAIKGYGMKDKRIVEMAADVTPTEGHELGVLEQLLGNVGRFNSDPRQPGMQGPGRP
jgi:outer membrane protein assembly factor BamE (lipoprotein component of BamABCDE complex)